MMRKYTYLAFMAFLCLGFSNLVMGQKKASDMPEFSSGEEGLTEMILWLLDAPDKDRKEFSKSLIPDSEDYDAVFQPEFGKRVFRYHKRLKRQINMVVRPYRKNQTDYLLWTTTSEELISYTGNARFFPGGYKEIATHFKPGLTLYRFKFIKPGMRLGSAYDVIVHVNGRWRLFPRPWVMSDELVKY